MSQTSLEDWIEQQVQISAREMLRSVSPVDRVKTRAGFGQVVRAVRGSIIASPVLADWDPEPDYFFHWFRDSALVIDALRQLHEDDRIGDQGLGTLHDFVRFSLSLCALDGRAAVLNRDATQPSFQQYLREPTDLACVRGDAVSADTRVNPDGTLDITKWSRPQHDGPALRALALLRWSRCVDPLDEPLTTDLQRLLRADLGFVRRHASVPSFDIWEEERGLHYYTLRVSAAALEQGATWLDSVSESDEAQGARAQARALLQQLDAYWLETAGHYRSRVLTEGARSEKDLDIAVILAAIHARGIRGAHSVCDPRLHATLDRLDALFATTYAINRGRSIGPAMGRYAGDRYHSGGAWYVSTLAAAELCYRAAAQEPRGTAWRARGDAYLQTVRVYTPADGSLSEQFDQTSGAPTSARHLAWSYAAFITCAAARCALSGQAR